MTILDTVNYEKNLNTKSTHTNTIMLVKGSKICFKYKSHTHTHTQIKKQEDK